MNNILLYNSFYFNQFHFQKFHTSDYTKGLGLPAHYIARMICGNAVIKTKHNTLVISEGDVFYLPKGLKYQSFWHADKNNRIVWYSFGFDAFPIQNESLFPMQTISLSPKANAIMDELCSDTTVNCSTTGLLYQFIGETLDSWDKDCHPYNSTTNKALEFMQNNVNFTMKDVAEYCNISESGLYPIFQRVFQQTPLEMKQKILCEKAVQLLTTTDLSVEEISNRLLFSSSTYFRKILKKYTGKTPLKIRSESQF